MMKTYAFYALDRTNSGDMRAALREDHRRHIRRTDPRCRCILGGPLRSADGEKMIGTLLVFEARDAASVEAFMRDDPYCRASLFDKVSVTPWTIGLGSIAVGIAS